MPFWELDNLGRRARHPGGRGEQEYSLENLRRMVDSRLVDAVQPDVCYVGGITRARQVPELAALRGKQAVNDHVHYACRCITRRTALVMRAQA